MKCKIFHRTQSTTHNHHHLSKRQVYAHNYINLNGDKFPYHYCHNRICSTHYKWYNFIIKNLYEQFHNIANLYFLLIIVTYYFVDHVGSVTVTIMPLVILISITMIKDGIDDLLRYHSDKQLNSMKYLLLNIDFDRKSIKWIYKKASLLNVGDIICCFNNQSFPCDLLLLYSSHFNGYVYINTMNLDGENNIKKYNTLKQYQSSYANYIMTTTNNTTYKNNNSSIGDDDYNEKQFNELDFQSMIEHLYLQVICEQPNENLTSFQGYYKTAQHLNVAPVAPDEDGSHDGDETCFPLTYKNLVLRGSKLISTDYIIGLVIYTGKDTKLSLNSSKNLKRKYSTRENLSNIILLIFMVAMVTITLLITILSTIWIKNNTKKIWYIDFELLTIWQFIRTIIRFLFIINYLIPISIIVTIEFQQLLLSHFISNDIHMYNPIENISSHANNSQLADELGQIKFLFCDKTGTLTQNFMVLYSCCLLNKEEVYLCDTYTTYNTTTDNHTTYNTTTDNPTTYNTTTDNHTIYNDHSNNDSNRINLLSKENSYIKYLKLPDMNKDFREFLTIITLCHTVELKNYNKLNDTTEMDHHNGNSNIQQSSMNNYEPCRYYEYEATSSDEKALVEGASKLGVVFSGKEPDLNETGSNRLYIDYWSYSSTTTTTKKESNNEKFLNRQCYIVDAVLEFDPIRKRMSVMVRYPDGTYYVLSKGAESTILDPEKCSTTSKYQRSRAIHYVNEYALNGLRTLVFAKRQLTQSIYMKLLKNLKLASNLLNDERIHALKQCYNDIEYDMEPIYVTAIEDKLQPGVKNCIKALKEAGIQIWILTGDKAETAITICQSIEHFTSNMSLIKIMNCLTLQSTAYKIYEQLDTLQLYKDYHKQKDNHHHNSSSYTIPRIKTINYGRSSSMSRSSSMLKSSSMSRSSSMLKSSSSYMNGMYNNNNNSNDDTYYYCGNSKSNFFLFNRKHCLLNRYIRYKHKKHPGIANESIGLVIDGKSLQYALHTSLRDSFLELCMSVTTVLCCRMTPLQKASIVKLVQIGLAKHSRLSMKPVIAAVGDGGNDVAMILQANIGVGVYGKEGREAVRAADYSVTEFRHIKRLFLLHGHWSYYRITITMLFFYHKAVAFVCNQLCVIYNNGYSEIPSFGTILFICYNLTMTFLVSLGYGMFERHIEEKILLNKPYLYKAISYQANLKAWYIFLWVIDGIWHGFITYFIPYYCLAGGNLYAEAIFYQINHHNTNGNYDFTMIGNASFVYLWISVTIRSTIWTKDFNLMLILCHIGTTLNLVILFVFQDLRPGYPEDVSSSALSYDLLEANDSVKCFTDRIPTS
uniref:P-type phospholipid transporter n=1 Tax=Schistosoma mansoni TaxID=6183 RepID=A0A5K4FBU5_SCHMA